MRSVARSVSESVRSRGRDSERGATTLTGIASIGVLLLAFVFVAQFTTWIYGRGALRAAAQDGVRQAAPLDSPAGTCEAAFDRVRSQLLSGFLGDDVDDVRCSVGSDFVSVEVTARFESWLPVAPGWETTVQAVAVREVDPS